MEIQVGDKVRSFDFAYGETGRDLSGPRASYVEGVVVAIADSPVCVLGCPHFHIEIIREVFGGVRSELAGEGRVGDLCYPPQFPDFGKRETVEKIA